MMTTLSNLILKRYLGANKEMSYLSIENRETYLGDINLEGFNLGKQPDGTYNVVFTAFNLHSTRGDFYMISDTVRNMFSEGSPMLIRVQNKEMKSEDGHPEMNPTQSLDSFRKRLLTYDDSNVCAVTNSVRLHDIPISVPNVGDEIYVMTANITPSGPRGKSLQQSLDNPSINTAFSIRSFSNNHVRGGVTYKDTYLIFNADWVDRPGIPIAKKSVWSNINLESDEHILTDKDKMIMLDNIDKELNSHNMEGHDTTLLRELRGIITGCDDGSCIYFNA